jgi:hypothetical protein
MTPLRREELAGDDRATAGLSRRQLLAAMTAVGATGGFVGVSTGASLADRESLFGTLTAGIVDLDVFGLDADGNALPSAGGVVSVPIDAVPGESGHAVVELSLPGAGNNPAYVWLRSACPDPAATALGEALTLTLSYADADGQATTAVGSDSFRALLSAYRNGLALDGTGAAAAAGDQACLDPADRLRLRLDWTLAPTYRGTESTTAEFAFVARQCRNTDAATNPFAGEPVADCPAGEPCERCEYLGKVDLPDDDPVLRAGREYPFNDDGDPAGYGIRVLDTVEKDPDGDTETVAVAFEVFGPDGASLAPCKAEVKGGTVDTVYVRGADAPLGSTDGFVTDDEGDASARVDGDLLYAPLGTDGSRRGISHIEVFVCVAGAAAIDGGDSR